MKQLQGIPDVTVDKAKDGGKPTDSGAGTNTDNKQSGVAVGDTVEYDDGAFIHTATIVAINKDGTYKIEAPHYGKIDVLPSDIGLAATEAQKAQQGITTGSSTSCTKRDTQSNSRVKRKAEYSFYDLQ